MQLRFAYLFSAALLGASVTGLAATLPDNTSPDA
jgi:hypothetical protein